MSLREYHIDGIVIIAGGYDDIRSDSFSSAQNADMALCRTDKQQRERALTYTLLNHAGRNHKSLSHITGAHLGHLDSGAPFLKAEGNQALDTGISLSHCRSGACIALGAITQQFGIDIEDVSDKLARVAPKFINAREATFIEHDMLLSAWTVKEAVYKAAGTPGLSLRDGIDIMSVTTATSGMPSSSDFPLEATAIAAGATFRCLIRPEGNRCITICRRI